MAVLSKLVISVDNGHTNSSTIYQIDHPITGLTKPKALDFTERCCEEPSLFCFDQAGNPIFGHDVKKMLNNGDIDSSDVLRHIKSIMLNKHMGMQEQAYAWEWNHDDNDLRHVLRLILGLLVNRVRQRIKEVGSCDEPVDEMPVHLVYAIPREMRVEVRNWLRRSVAEFGWQLTLIFEPDAAAAWLWKEGDLSRQQLTMSLADGADTSSVCSTSMSSLW